MDISIHGSSTHERCTASGVAGANPATSGTDSVHKAAARLAPLAQPDRSGRRSGHPAHTAGRRLCALDRAVRAVLAGASPLAPTWRAVSDGYRRAWTGHVLAHRLWRTRLAAGWRTR